MTKKINIWRVLLAVLWIVLGTGSLVLLVAAIRKKDERHCSGLNIDIKGVSNHFFVDKNDIRATISAMSGGNPKGRPTGAFNLQRIEQELQRNIWIRQAQLYFDNNEVLQVKVQEREPIARVFSVEGSTFYVDSARAMLPLSDKFSARLPIFTGFPTDKKVLIRADSVLLRDIVTVSAAIQADPFLMALIDQVDITADRRFELVPKLGNNIIVLGDAGNLDEKFSKLETFYRDVLVKSGWNRYSVVNVQYQGQVVAVRRDAKEVYADSMRTLQLMKMIASNAEKMASDTINTLVQDNEQNTVNKNLIQQSIEREDNAGSEQTPAPVTPVTLPPAQAPKSVPPALQPVKPAAATVKPKPAAKPKVQPAVAKPKVQAPAAKPKPATGKPKLIMPQEKKKPANEYR